MKFLKNVQMFEPSIVTNIAYVHITKFYHWNMIISSDIIIQDIKPALWIDLIHPFYLKLKKAVSQLGQ